MGWAEAQVHNCRSVCLERENNSVSCHSLSTKDVNNSENPQNNFSQRINRAAISMHVPGFNITAKFWLKAFILPMRKSASFINVQQHSMWHPVVPANPPHSYFQQQKFRLCSQTFSKVLLLVMQLSVSECTMTTVCNQKNCFVTRESCPQLFYKYAGSPQLTSDIPPSQLKLCLQITSFYIFTTMCSNAVKIQKK